MSGLPPTIDEILASIRTRVTGDVLPEVAPDEPLPAVVEVTAAARAVLPELGAVGMAGSGMSLEALMRSLLEPLVKAWLDAHLPEIVSAAAEAEIRRLTGKP